MMRVDVWIPVHRWAEASMVQCLMAMQKHELERGVLDVSFHWLVGESLISRGRNTIANNFLSSEAEYLLMIDSDLIFEKNVLEKLISHDKKLIGGNYVHKGFNKRWAGVPDSFDDEISPSSFVPTGMMLIHKSVFQLMKDHVPKFVTSEHNPCYGFFNTMVADNQYLSEDWAFSYRCRKAKIVGFIDNFVRLGHIGNKIFTG